MSYDIRFGVKVDGMDGYIAVIDMPEYDNPTYNLRDMFVACMDWDYSQGKWYNCTEVLPKFERGVHELTFYPNKYRKYDAPNGWGTVESALRTLKSFIEKTGQIISGDWSENGIPLEHLWMRW